RGMLLSLVAIANDRVVGHVAYSAAVLNGELDGAALGPMAVLPEYQRKSIGSRLIEHGNRRMRAGGLPYIIVVGHPAYYPRFGFTVASAHGIRCEWDLAEEAVMLLTFDEKILKNASGVARYRPEFSTMT